jgi:CRISPR-associated protein Cas1
MGDRIVEISGAPARLSIRHRQLVIDQEMDTDIAEGRGAATVPLEDLAMLILDRADVSLTQPVLTGLAEAGAALAACGPDHLPAAVSLPLAGHWAGTERALDQLDAAKPLRKRLWQALVRRKIEQQAFVLAAMDKPVEGLTKLATRVRSGDPDNLEAQAAQRYWPALMGRAFRRRRDADGALRAPNALLNYGYAVLRAAVGRALVGAGLLPMVGLHHRGRGNPFCLADDLMEPFRPFVDLRVASLLLADAVPEEIGRPEKAALISVLHERVRMSGPTHDGRALSVLQATQTAATSLARAYRDGLSGGGVGGAALTLPTGTFVAPPDDGEAEGEAIGEADAAGDAP